MNDSYSATRIHVMETKLIRNEEYERLLKMEPMEIVSFLHSTEYKEDIDALALKDLEDLEIIDRIIARNIERTFAKLQRIASPAFKEAIASFLEENDRWNLRIIAEAIAGGSNPKDMLGRYGRRGTFDATRYCRAASIEELGKTADGKCKELRHHPKSLAAFIDALAAHNHGKLKCGAYLIDEQNILRLLACKRARMQPDQTMRRMIRGGTLPHSILHTAAQAENVDEARKSLRSTKYGPALSEGDLVQLEYELHRAVVRRIKRTAGTYPLRPEVVVRYIVQKDLEAENIRLLIKGKQLGLEEGFIREQLST